MALPRETGRQRAMRIPLDYYKRATPLERGKLALAAVGLLLAGGWIGYLFATGESGKTAFSHGPVAAVHAQWEGNCEACHVPFEPISPWNFLMPQARQRTGHRLGSDARCEACHPGPPHHASQKLERTPNCGGCHREHQGRDASLVRLPDATCTGCHADLPAATTTGRTLYAASVTAFPYDQNHPEFRVLKDKMKDPGVVKFNHKLHLTPGQKIAPDQLGPWTLGRIKKLDPVAAERYRGAAWQTDKRDEAEVVLDCRSCHVPDTGTMARRTTAAVLPNRTPGAYMAPIDYDSHCKACHPLSYDDRNPAARVPHHLQPEAVEQFLTRAYAAEPPKAEAPATAKVPSRPLPGKPPAAPGASAPATTAERVTAAMRDLFIGKRGCGECHYAEGKVTGEGYLTAVPDRIQVRPTAATRAAGWFTQQTPIPEVWYHHAKFDHSRHQNVDCRDCHAAAFPLTSDGKPNPTASSTHWDVMLPGVETCRNCHAPARSEKGVLTAGARYECTECHLYHHPESASPATSAGARPGETALDLRRFLESVRD